MLAGIGILTKIYFQEDNIVDELKNYKISVEDFKSFKQYIEELSSQLNILSNESKFSQKVSGKQKYFLQLDDQKWVFFTVD